MMIENCTRSAIIYERPIKQNTDYTQQQWHHQGKKHKSINLSFEFVMIVKQQ